MYDTIVCNYELPMFKQMQNDYFHTKSLERDFSLYIITEEGELTKSRINEREFIPYNGYIIFYGFFRGEPSGFVDLNDEKENPLINFLASFNDGKLQSIKKYNF